jgi:chromosome partitioning protein
MRPETRFHKIAVLNTKGGCGKTTLATNLAAAFALGGPPPTLLDHDPNGFSLRWLEKRPISRSCISGVAAHEDGVPRLANKRVDPRSQIVVADLPAGISLDELYLQAHDADSILIPVLPSEIDAYTTSRFIGQLLLDVQLDLRLGKVAIVANRVRQHTNSFRMLQRFLSSLQIPLLATLRDSQAYVQAAAQGLGIVDLPPHQAAKDLEGLNAIRGWIEKRRNLAMVLESVQIIEHRPTTPADALSPA